MDISTATLAWVNLVASFALGAAAVIVAHASRRAADKSNEIAESTRWLASLSNEIAGYANAMATRANKMSEMAVARELRAEAASLTWWLEVTEGDKRGDSTYTQFLSEEDYGSYGRDLSDEDDRFYITLVVQTRPDAPVIANVEAMPDPELVVGEYQDHTAIGMIRPGQEIRLCIPTTDDTSTPKAYNNVSVKVRRGSYYRWVEFTAPSGQRWRRWRDGSLTSHDV